MMLPLPFSNNNHSSEFNKLRRIVRRTIRLIRGIRMCGCCWIGCALSSSAALPLSGQILERRQITTTTVIDGITCAPTGKASAEFHPSGRLAWCPIAADTVLFGQELPALTWIGLDANGRLARAWLPRNTELSGHLCHGTGHQGFSVEFYPGGQLKLCFLAEDTLIQGVPCIRGTFWTEVRGGGKSAVRFRENGRLAGCQAATDFTHAGIKVRQWQVVAVDDGGHVLPPR